MNEAAARRASTCPGSASDPAAVAGRLPLLAKASKIGLMLLGAALGGLDDATLWAGPPVQITVSTDGFRPGPSQSAERYVGGSGQGTVWAIGEVQNAGHEVGRAVGHEVPQRPQPAPEVAPAPESLPLPDTPPDALGASDRPIGHVRTDIEPSAGKLPPDDARRVFADGEGIQRDLSMHRLWQPMRYCWEASALCHRPLYFEEVNLERYGYTSPRLRLVQPALSGARFFATVPALPYLVSGRRPCECVYTLGHYRPGSCVPYRRHWPELRLIPASVEAATATGLVFLIP